MTKTTASGVGRPVGRPSKASASADELRARVLEMAASPEYQHPSGGQNPACVPGAPNASKIAPQVGVTRARVQQILREAREPRVAVDTMNGAV